MRFLIFTVLHLFSILAVFSPMVLFALPSTVNSLPFTGNGLFLGLSIYWFFAPCLVGIVGGVLIDLISRKWTGANHYDKQKWSKTRRRIVFMTILGSAIMYLHFWLQPAIEVAN